MFTAVCYAPQVFLTYFTFNIINIWYSAGPCCHVDKKYMGLSHLKIWYRNSYWMHFWWKFHLTLHKVLMEFLYFLLHWGCSHDRNRVALVSLDNRFCWSVCCSWLGCSRRCSRGSRTSGQLRDRSPHWRRHRINCWRSWTLPGPDWERQATSWLHCRFARTPTDLWGTGSVNISDNKHYIKILNPTDIYMDVFILVDPCWGSNTQIAQTKHKTLVLSLSNLGRSFLFLVTFIV